MTTGKLRGGGGLKRMKILTHKFDDIVSVDNLLLAWQEFVKGKKSKSDVAEFNLHLMDNIFKLHQELVNHTYRHGLYQAFNLSDPKPRNIHKATVRDRLLHHAIYRILYPYFDLKFIADSYSCRLNKGTHKALDRFRRFGFKVSQNNTKTCWILKCDIKKFFASVDQAVLLGILGKYISDQDILWLLGQIIKSFNPGLPLGNLTSQLLVNVYMDEFDQFVKHELKIKYYIRYADDFVILDRDWNKLINFRPRISQFLQTKLKLTLHPDKVFVKTLSSGVDFLGWVHFPDHRVLRTSSKRKMFRRLAEHSTEETKQSYLGLLRHGNTQKLKNRLLYLYDQR